MEKIKKIIDDNRAGIFGIAVLSILLVYGICMRNKMNREGVVTIAKVVKAEGAYEGADLYLKIKYQGKEYDNIANKLCYSCVGKYFFVKIFKDDPTGDVVFLDDTPVPDCIMEKTIPQNGWLEIPNCR